MIREYTDEELTAEIVAALDLVYAPPEVPRDIPGSNVRRGPWRNRYGIAATVAAGLVLLLAYPAVTGINTGSHRHPAKTEAAPAASGTATVTSLASLRPVTVDASGSPLIKSEVLDHHRVTAWVASVKRSGKYVYDLGSAKFTHFSAVLPPSDSGLTDPCSWTVRLGGGPSRMYRTQQTASVPMAVEGSGPMTITVGPTQPTSGTASCAMTDPVVQAAAIGTAASSAPEPVASQVLASPCGRAIRAADPATGATAAGHPVGSTGDIAGQQPAGESFAQLVRQRGADADVVGFTFAGNRRDTHGADNGSRARTSAATSRRQLGGIVCTVSS